MQSINQMSSLQSQSHNQQQQQSLVVEALIIDASNVNVPEQFIPGLDAIVRARNELSEPKEAVVIGSTPGPSNRKAKWQQLGYAAHFVEIKPGEGEQFVDDALVAHMQRAVLNVILAPDPRPSRHLIVLVTGDGGENEGRPSFKQAVQVALRAGLNVKLICYKPNPVYQQFKQEFGDQLQIQEINKVMVQQASLAAAPPLPITCSTQQSSPAVQQSCSSNAANDALSFAAAAHAYLLNRPQPATSSASAVLLSQLGIALHSEKPSGAGKFKVAQCLQGHPSRFRLLDLDKPGFGSVYVMP